MSGMMLTENILIDGPVGHIEATLEKYPKLEPRGVIIICHPHPLYGGNMQNKVVHTIARACLNKKIMVIRFNFRGVGSSQGCFDEGIGEYDDLICVINYIQNQYPRIPIWLGGFSFGGGIAIRVASAIKLKALITIAPSVFKSNFLIKDEPICPWLIIHGNKDELIKVQDLIDWHKKLEVIPKIVIVDEATHFFHGCLVVLRAEIETFIEQNI